MSSRTSSGWRSPSAKPETKRDPKRELEDLELVFKALAHPSRRQILLVLQFRGGEVGAGDIASRFACTWPTTTRHLRVLREAGLVRVVGRGRKRFYRLERERLQRVVGEWLAGFDEGGCPSSCET